MAALCLVIAGVGAQPAALAQPPKPPQPAAPATSAVHPLLGMGFGIDHVVLVVRDIEAARTLFRDRLGFKLPAAGVVGKHPSGTVNASAYFADQSYLELLAVADREKVARNNPGTLAFLDKHEGALIAAMSTSSASESATRLGVIGLPAKGPQPGTIERATDTKPAGPKWLTVDFTSPPPVPLFFIQYLNMDYADMSRNWDEGYAEAKAANYYRHPNTATGISALWIAVDDIARASKVYEDLLGAKSRDFKSAALGASVREFRVVRQRILLIQPDVASGPAGRYITERGPGVMGMSVEVQDMNLVAERLKALPTPGAMPGPGLVSAHSLVVPASLAAGLWIEFHGVVR